VRGELGLDQLTQRLAELLAGSGSRSSAWLGMTAARCRDSLEHAAAALSRAEAAAGRQASEELLAVDLREALEHLGIIVGAVYTDDLLDRIFSKFCIGK
jgi:tRNA modification GTPase